jgi:hypothetical protein
MNKDMHAINNFIKENSYPLFKTIGNNNLCALFDKKGFEFSELAVTAYNEIKSQPHLYVAYGNGFSYIGKSFQKNGRWKRGHYYHLGTLAHELLPDLLKNDEQRHDHWIAAWMILDSLNICSAPFSINLRDEIKIAFIPFVQYSNGVGHEKMCKQEIRHVNKIKEVELIRFLRSEGIQLLNKQNNK